MRYEEELSGPVDRVDLSGETAVVVEGLDVEEATSLEKDALVVEEVLADAGRPVARQAEKAVGPDPRSKSTASDAEQLPAEAGAPFLSRLAAAGLIVFSAPLFGVLALVVWVSSGRPIFYSGERLGRGKRLFKIFKFRTLVPDAQRILGSRLMSDSAPLTTPVGRFLRATRLDELPQLYNIVRGEMGFLGPRPERPEVYEEHCQNLADYDLRFEVLPGLIGHSQIFTPHSTPKRFRTLLDNLRVRESYRLGRGFGLVIFTAMVSVTTSCRRLWEKLVGAVSRSTAEFQRDRRTARRLRPRNATVHLDVPSGQADGLELVDLNDSRLLMAPCDSVPRGSSFEFRLQVPVRRRGRLCTKRALCTGRVVDERRRGGSSGLLVEYKSHTPISQYFLAQYFLEQSFAVPFRRT